MSRGSGNAERDAEREEVLRLLSAHRSGDPGAFGALARTYYAELLALARRRLGSREDAEDAVQETLLLALRAFPRFGRDGELHLRAWLHRILSNVCHRLRARRRPALPLYDALPGTVRAMTAPGDVADQVGDPVAYREVAHAVGHLPDPHRRAFLLRAVEELPYDELARREGITCHNARARVTRARAQLRDELAVRAPASPRRGAAEGTGGRPRRGRPGRGPSGGGAPPGAAPALPPAPDPQHGSPGAEPAASLGSPP